MATHHGKEGTVKVGSAAIAEITNFEVTQTVRTVDDTSINDPAETHLTGREAWSGSLTCHWDETDSTGQEALTVGASVTLNLYPEGASSGDQYYSGTATITQVRITVAMDAVTQRTFDFLGNGALSKSTVSP